MRTIVVVALSALLAPAADGAETLDELLGSRALESVVHPIAAEFVAAEGSTALTEQQRAAAVAQLKRSLERQTNPMVLSMRGMGSAMNTPSMQRMREAAPRSVAGGLAGGLLRSAVGIGGGSVPEMDADQASREMQQAMAEPWVRGIGAARALAALGDAEAAARFYVACLQMLADEWAPAACLEDIIGLGPRRAEVLLTWMLDNAAALSESASPFAVPFDDDADGGGSSGEAQLEGAALEGLGALVGGGRMQSDARERAFATLLRHVEARDNQRYLLGLAEGLARSKDPRALEHLERLADRRNSLDVRQAAVRGLAVGFGDEGAIRALRRELDGKDNELSLRAAQVLYELADEAAFEWAVDVITQRRTANAGGPDVRGQVVRDLVELGGEPSRQALQAALDEGSRNEWIEAWVAVGLLELGDESVVPRVEAALTTDDWDLDPRGVRSIWRAIKPFFVYATQLAMSGGTAAVSSSDQLRQVTSLIGNAVTSERSRQLTKLGQRESLTAQLRWQAADAIAKSQPEGSLRMLRTLLADPTPGVQGSAALALARSGDVEALPLLESAYDASLMVDQAVPHLPELRATLVRAAVLHSRTAPATQSLLAKAQADPDAGVRFIALAAAN